MFSVLAYFLANKPQIMDETLIKEVEIRIKPTFASDRSYILSKAQEKAFLKQDQFKDWKIVKRSIDARQSQPLYVFRIAFYRAPISDANNLSKLKKVTSNKKAIVIGAGPAGYFAALKLIELGIKPLVFERGKEVQRRRRDLKAIQQDGVVDPDSNYCFGEGGAGTYSDGKLYTRSHKRGKIKDILQLLVDHGATEEIKIDAHPHIGSNKLPKIVENIRHSILALGGEIHFDAAMTDIIIKDEQVKGVVINDEKEILAPAVVLATGHSARDIFYLLDSKKVNLEFKPFAIGVRIEHPQQIIDQIQYGQKQREENLPAASYSLASQVNGRGVFSFCMCPGGLVVPAATAPGEIVVNGMSLSRRDSPFANAGTVTEIHEKHLTEFTEDKAFKGLSLQQSIEQKMFEHGDGTQKAPAQKLTDFVDRKLSSTLSESSYIPGLIPARLDHILPKSIYLSLREGVLDFGKKMKGYFTEQANVIGTESRTSSPIKIPRNKDNFMNDQLSGLFPCGEGGGYAGGIVSAALDGQNVAKAVADFLE